MSGYTPEEIAAAADLRADATTRIADIGRRTEHATTAEEHGPPRSATTSTPDSSSPTRVNRRRSDERPLPPRRGHPATPPRTRTPPASAGPVAEA
jgi:hypothetical protein